MEIFEEKGHVLFEEEYTTILNKFIERKIRFFPMFSMMNLDAQTQNYSLRFFEDIEMTKVHMEFSLSEIDFIQTGMTVNSMGDQFELLKMVTLKAEEKQREIYVIGFIQYQVSSGFSNWVIILSFSWKSGKRCWMFRIRLCIMIRHLSM